MIKSVKCDNGGWKICFIPSISDHKCDTTVFSIPMPSYEPNFILLAQVSTKVAYLSMLFILELACTAV